MSPFFVALALVAVAQLWWLWPAVTGQVAFFTRDTLFFRLPYQSRLGDELAAGRAPLWAPEFGGGMPLWHHPSAENADPLTAVFALLPPHHANGVNLALHVALATVGVALLCRSVRVHPVLCAWAGLLYACSGPAASFYSVGLLDVTTLPWVVLAVRLCARRHRWAIPATALTIAYRLLRPDPMMVAATGILALAVAWGAAARASRRSLLRDVVTGGVLGAMLAAPFLLPAAGVVANSDRATVVQGLPQDDLSLFFLVDTLAPGATGLAGASGVEAGLARARKDAAFIWHAFVGMTTLALLVLGAVRGRRHRLDALLAVSAVAFAVLSRGASLPGIPELLAATSSRFPDKLLLPAALAVIVLGARLGTTALRRRKTPGAQAALASLGAIGLLAVLGAEALTSSFAARYGAGLPVDDLPHALQRMQAAITQSGLVLGCSAVALLAALAAERARQLPWLLLVVALGALEGITSLDALLIKTPVARLAPEASPLPLRPIDSERLYSGNASLFWAGGFAVASADAAVDENARLHLALGTPLAGALRGARYPVNADVSRLEPARMRELAQDALPRLPPQELANVLRKLGVERIIYASATQPTDGVTLEGMVTFRGRDPYADLRVVDPVPVVTLETTWDRRDGLKATTLALAGAARVVTGPEAPAPEASDPQARLEVLTHEPRVLQARTRSTSTSLLVVREVFDPSWEATVDGEPASIIPVNWCQRGVLLPAGEHVVTMRHTVPGLVPGMALAGLGLLGLGWRVRRLRSA